MTDKDQISAPVVTIHDGKAVTSSKDVAAFFGKQHKDVLKAIRNIVGSEPELGRRNFAPFENKDLTGISTSHYEMDRDGFTLLAMGFTGERALKWKIRYIEAFNAMEREINRSQAQPEQLALPMPIAESDRRAIIGSVTKNFRADLDKVVAKLTEQQRHLWRAMSKPTNAVHLNSAGFVEVGGVYRLAGLEPGEIPALGKLSNNVSRAMDAFCKRHKVLVTSAPIGTRDVTHWPKDAVIAWLAETGHAMIRNHLAVHQRPKVVPLSIVPTEKTE